MKYNFNKKELSIIIDMMQKLSIQDLKHESCADKIIDSINDNKKNYGNVNIDWNTINNFTDKISKYEKDLNK
tara:strand:+ start:223 stop:438 length:216 start_codon:yes stop_codon:yes gene_type:complete